MTNGKVLKGAWLTVFLLCFVGLLNYFDRMMIATMRESVLSEIPMTDAQFGLLTSVFLWVYAICSPFAGFIADRFKKSRLIIGSLFVWSGVTWMTGHATTFNELLIARALMGISEAFYIPAALSLIIDYHKGPTQSLATGIHLTKAPVDSNMMPTLCMVIDGRYRATGYGLMNMFATCIGGVGIYVAGALRDSQINLDIMFRMASLSIIVCVGLLLLVKRDLKKTKKK